MNLKRIIKSYLSQYSDEAGRLNRLLEQPGDILSRKNFAGHVTVSAFVINENGKQVLLLEHKSLACLLQPGGHIEKDDESLLGAALREIEEETGIKRHEVTLKSAMPQSREIPFDIDIHLIPENKLKNEPAHYHFDFRYLYTTRKNSVRLDPSESNGYKWVEWEDFIDSPNFINIADKISSVLEPNVRGFFKSLIPEKSGDISVLAVSHIIPSSEDYLNSLQQNFSLIGVIPKPRSINKSTHTRIISNGISVLDQFTRESINHNPQKLIKLLQNYDNICLIDIGGYFSKSASELKKHLGEKLLGIVEDTENGHQKYEKSLPSDLPVMSVARSQLKDYEDHLVGHSIVHATETVLREINVLITYKKCGVIGYGKVGKGITEYLLQRNICPMVSEINPLRSVQASCDGAVICSTDELIRESDVLFCATGARALDIFSLNDLRTGAFLASATSSEDEFDLSLIDSHYEKQILDNHTTRYSKRGHYFHLLNDGNAVNFLYAAAVDRYINLVQGELIFCIGKISGLAGKKAAFNKIITTKTADHEKIARTWLFYVLNSNQASSM